MLRDGRSLGRVLPSGSAPNAYWRNRRLQAELNRLGPQSPTYPMQIGVRPLTSGDRTVLRDFFCDIWAKVN